MKIIQNKKHYGFYAIAALALISFSSGTWAATASGVFSMSRTYPAFGGNVEIYQENKVIKTMVSRGKPATISMVIDHTLSPHGIYSLKLSAHAMNDTQSQREKLLVFPKGPSDCSFNVTFTGPKTKDIIFKVMSGQCFFKNYK